MAQKGMRTHEVIIQNVTYEHARTCDAQQQKTWLAESSLAARLAGDHRSARIS